MQVSSSSKAALTESLEVARVLGCAQGRHVRLRKRQAFNNWLEDLPMFGIRFYGWRVPQMFIWPGCSPTSPSLRWQQSSQIDREGAASRKFGGFHSMLSTKSGLQIDSKEMEGTTVRRPLSLKHHRTIKTKPLEPFNFTKTPQKEFWQLIPY